jgi:hypothetical protein
MPKPKRYSDAAAKQRAYRERRKLARLKGLVPASNPPNWPQLKALARQAEAVLNTLLNKMESYQDLRSEAWQDGARGQAFEEALAGVQEALEAVQDIR